MLWNHDSSLRVVWILFFSPYSSGTLFATPFSIVTLLFALCEPCLSVCFTPFHMVTPFSAIYEQSRGAGSSDGEGATKDRRNVSQRCWSDLVLSHPQLSFDHAQAGPFHVGCTGCGLCRQAFACRLGTYVVTKN